MLLGAPFVPMNEEVLKRMIALLQVRPGEKAADLGSGDGRVVIALAKAGARAQGYEINPFLVFASRRNISAMALEIPSLAPDESKLSPVDSLEIIRHAGVATQASIYWKNFWKQDLSSFQAITLFGMPHMMKRLQEKLKRELKPGARVVSHQFMFPDWPVSQQESQLYLYRIS